MTFNPNIPQPTDNLSDSQGDILANFQSSNTSFGIDHYPFDNLTAQNGIHKQVRMASQAAPGFAPGNGVLYAALINGNSWPVWQNVLGSTSMLASESRALANGYASLPGAMLIQWGVFTRNPNLNQTETINFATANKIFPTACFVVIPTLIPAAPPTNNSQCLSVRSKSATQFVVNYTGGAAYNGFYWIAIGN